MWISEGEVQVCFLKSSVNSSVYPRVRPTVLYTLTQRIYQMFLRRYVDFFFFLQWILFIILELIISHHWNISQESGGRREVIPWTSTDAHNLRSFCFTCVSVQDFVQVWRNWEGRPESRLGCQNLRKMKISMSWGQTAFTSTSCDLTQVLSSGCPL